MKITVDAQDGTRPVILSTLKAGNTTDWFIDEAGLEGWYGVPEPKAPSDLNIPQFHGEYFPSVINIASRKLTVRGVVVSGLGGSAKLANAQDKINMLTGKIVRVTVDDANGVRWCDGYIAAAVEAQHEFHESYFTFSLVINCPDPKKYSIGVLEQFEDTVEVISVGSAPAPVFFESLEELYLFEAKFESSRGSKSLKVVLEKPAEIYLDTSEMIAYDKILWGQGILEPIGTVTHEGAVLLEAGISYTVTVSKEVNMEVLNAWW